MDAATGTPALTNASRGCWTDRKGDDVAAEDQRRQHRHQCLTLPEHEAKQLRRDRIGLARSAAEPDTEFRRLADYDTALGLDSAGGDESGGDDVDEAVP